MRRLLKAVVVCVVILLCGAGWCLRHKTSSALPTARSRSAISLAQLSEALTAADAEFGGIKTVQSELTRVNADLVAYRLRIVDHRNVSYVCEITCTAGRWRITRVHRRFEPLPGLSI